MPKKLSKNNNLATFALVFISLVIVSCSSLDVVPNKTDWYGESMDAKGNTLQVDSIPITERLAKMLGDDLNLELKNGITFEVALSQFSIMPLLSVDRAGGIIITDWYSSSSADERVKFNIIIKDEMMNDASININMFKETFDGTSWRQSKVNNETVNQIKNLILEKAKRLQATAELS